MYKVIFQFSTLGVISHVQLGLYRQYNGRIISKIASTRGEKLRLVSRSRLLMYFVILLRAIRLSC